MKNQFFLCPTAFMEHMQLSHTDKAVLLALCSWAMWDEKIEYGSCFPSLNSISNRSSCTKSTVCKSLNKLEDLGLLQRNRYSDISHSKSTEYLLLANESNTQSSLSGKRTGTAVSTLNGQDLSVEWTKAVRQANINKPYNKPNNTPGIRAQELELGCPTLLDIVTVNNAPATLSLVINLWNEILVPLEFRGVIKGSPSREEAFSKLIDEDNRRQAAQWWDVLIKLIASSDFLVMSAQKKAPWLDFDWLLDESHLVKICEGKYINSTDYGLEPENGCRLITWDEGEVSEE